MIQYRIAAWVHPQGESALMLLAQIEQVFEKASGIAERMGSGNDSVRFGITIVALFVIVGALAWLYISSMRSTLTKQEARICDLEKELRDFHAVAEERHDDLREDYDKRLAGYWGLMEIALRELTTNNRWLQGQGLVPRQHETPPIQLPQPPLASTPQRPSSFLPSGPRRVPRRPRLGLSGAPDGQGEET